MAFKSRINKEKKMSTLGDVGSTLGGAVVNAAAVAAAIVILRSGKANDPKLIAGAFAIYASAKRAGQLNGELLGEKVDQLLKTEFDIDVDKQLEGLLEGYLMPVLEEYYDYKNSWSEWFDSILDDSNTQSQALPNLDDLMNFNPNDPNNFDPNDGYPLNPPSDDNNTNAPDSGNNNDEDNTPDPLNPPPPPKDPLVLDTDKDGFISTIALSDSNAYFDITGDGIKERVSWIAANDGILVYDKNESGKIDGIDEVFGNFTKNGFEELKELIDSNYDGKIDRQDELFNRLQIWNDLNGDGTTQANELQSLKDTGVKSIDLNYVTTNITLGGATLTEASKYTDAQGNKELVADVNLEYNPILTTVDTSTIPDYSVDPDTLFLPQLRGYGLIMDSFISYNTNDALKEKALELQAGGIQAIAEGFESMRHLKYKNTSWHLVQNKIELKREVA
jgi:hypothetical protein